MKKHHRHENDCLNCGAELQGQFCHVCGQENLHVKEPFWHFLSHSISHYFHFDSKFFETIIPLLTKPGQLTLDYLAGKRARYLHPVSMYIFVSILYFLVVPNLDHTTSGKTHSKSGIQNASDSLKNEIDSDVNKDLKKDGIVLSDKKNAVDTDKIKLTYNDKGFSALSIIDKGLFLDSLSKVYKTHHTDTLKQQIRHYSKLVAADAKSVTSIFTDDDDEPGKQQSRNSISKFIHQFVSPSSRSEEFNKELEHYRPKVFFVLMPLFAFFLMLNFRRNHRYYVEHIVFTIHFFTAYFIFELVVAPIDHYLFHNDSDVFAWITFAFAFWYCYKALQKFYERPRWVTIRKLVTLSMMMLVAYSISQGVIYAIVYLIS